MEASDWTAVPLGAGLGQRCSPRALLPAVEFFRVFLPHHVESVCNGSILKEKGTESRSLVSGHDCAMWKEGKHRLSWKPPNFREEQQVPGWGVVPPMRVDSWQYSPLPSHSSG